MTLATRVLVKISFAASGIHTIVVNRRTPDLFPLITVLNKQFIPATITSRRAFYLAGRKSAKPLKINKFP